MADTVTVGEIRGFYEQWSPTVFTFCRLYLGDDRSAEAATAEAFADFLKFGQQLHPDRLPVGLVRAALASVRRFSVAVPEHTSNHELSHIVMSVPADERAVFIMHASVGLHFRCIATVAGVSRQRIQQLWHRSLGRVLQYLPDFDPQEHRRSIAIQPRSTVGSLTMRLEHSSSQLRAASERS